MYHSFLNFWREKNQFYRPRGCGALLPAVLLVVVRLVQPQIFIFTAHMRTLVELLLGV